MSLSVLGINHKTATVDLREQVAFSPEQLRVALGELKQLNTINSAVIVSTCNRTEIYYEQEKADKTVVSQWLERFHQLDGALQPAMLYHHHEQDAAAHLMHVASGLDSLVLGEPQILGQVKQAYQDASLQGAVSGKLERLFQRSFTVAKRVRTETEIGGNAVSVAFAACSLAKQIFESLADSTVLLVGAGETIELVAKHLYDQQCRSILVANRTRERAQPFADAFGAKIISLEAIPEYMVHADIVISSTAAPLPIIGKGMVEKTLKGRRHRPMLLIDIAVPRDIEAQVAELNDVYLYTVDDLHSIVEQNIEQRKTAAKEAKVIIDEESVSFMGLLRSLSAVDSIRQYRAQSEAYKDALVAKSLQSLASGVAPEKVLLELSNKLTNKLIHAPTQALQTAAQNSDEHRLSILRQSLGLDPLN